MLFHFRDRGGQKLVNTQMKHETRKQGRLLQTGCRGSGQAVDGELPIQSRGSTWGREIQLVNNVMKQGNNIALFPIHRGPEKLG